MKTCVVCGNQLPEDAAVCRRCGFPTECRRFLSERHYRAWMQETVEPARLNWQRQELARQRRELEMQKQLFAEQKRQIEEQRRKLEEQQKSKKEPERPAQNRRTEWNTADSGWNQTAKEQKTKKKGGVVKNALISFVEFVTAGLISRAVIAPSSSPSSASSGETQPYIEASIDAETEPVALSQEQLDKAAEVGFDLNLFENLPLTSREDILAWLNNNNYLYEESGIGNSWKVRIQAKGEGRVRVEYEAQRVGSQPKYTMTYHYHENYLSDSLEETVNQLMNELHRKGSHSYYDNAETYDVSKLSAERRSWRKAEQSEIDEQTDQLIRMLKEMPKIEEKQETLHWIEENSDSYEDFPELWCQVDLGIWDGEYGYEKWWQFVIYSGNPEQYYRAICEKLKNAGYEEEKEFSRDSRQITDYTLSGKMRVKTIYDLGLHYAAVTCMPE